MKFERGNPNLRTDLYYIYFIFKRNYLSLVNWIVKNPLANIFFLGSFIEKLDQRSPTSHCDRPETLSLVYKEGQKPP